MLFLTLSHGGTDLLTDIIVVSSKLIHVFLCVAQPFGLSMLYAVMRRFVDTKNLHKDYASKKCMQREKDSFIVNSYMQL